MSIRLLREGRSGLSTAVLGLSFLLIVAFLRPTGAAQSADAPVGSPVPAVAAQSGGGRLSYTIHHYYDGTWYTGISLADMNYDGVFEVLIGNRDSSALEIYRYEPQARSLAFLDSIAFPYHIHDIKAADFDHDGDMDIAVGLRDYGLYYVTNSGSPGTIGSWSVEEIDGHYSWQVLVEDFDGDGNLDIFHGADYGPIKTWYGDGAGGFVAGAGVEDPATDMRFPRGFGAADLNGDEQLDLIGVDGSFLRAFLNPGDRSSDWTSAGPGDAIGNYPCCDKKWLMADVSPSAGDLDGNGVADQVASLHNRPSGANTVMIFKGSYADGSLVWSEVVLDTIKGVGQAAHTGVADLDRDGNLDVHVGGGEKFDGLYVYLGNGRGGFTPQKVELDHGVGGMNSFAVGDVNGDGAPDIVTTPYTAGNGEKSGFEVLFGSVNQPLLTSNQLTRVSTTVFGGQRMDDSWMPAISPDGRYITFTGDGWVDESLDPDYFNHHLFMKDLQTDDYTVVAGSGVNSDFFANSVVSRNGLFVANEHYDIDAPEPQGIVLHDIEQNKQFYIARNEELLSPAISDDGEVVAFEFSEDNLVSEDSNGYRDVFVYDHGEGKIKIVSMTDSGGQIIYGDGDSYEPSISADGRYVAFKSVAGNLVGDQCEVYEDCSYALVHDRQTGQTTLVDKAFDNLEYYLSVYAPVISPDGEYVAYGVLCTTNEPQECPSGIVVKEWQSGVEWMIEYDGSHLRVHDIAISNGGDFVAFLHGTRQVYLYNHHKEELRLISVSPEGVPGNNHSDRITVSADGRYVAFESEASNLVDSDTNESKDVFVYDRLVHDGLLSNPEGLVSAGEYHSCGLTPSGSAGCWGAALEADDHGQAQDQVGPYSEIGAGAIHSCGLRPDGRVDCWGTQEWYGQGAGHAGPFNHLSVGGNHNCGLFADGSVECWGGNWAGQADGKASPYVQVSAGWDHTCGLTPVGVIECWGANDFGQSEAWPGRLPR